MPSLKVIRETEVPNPTSPMAGLAPTVPETAKPSAPSFDLSRPTLAMLAEIRRVLNARLTAVLAMAGAFLLTGAAMWQATGMSLAIALSYDVFALIPMLVIAYMKPKG